MAHRPYSAEFPRLTRRNHRITSSCDPDYNCIAWAANCNADWWWPRTGPSARSYWPPGARHEVSLRAFVQAFQLLGYVKCVDGSLEPGYQKVAIFIANNKPTHAARQLPSGKWTSKLGRLEDIEHTSVEDVNGPLYGVPAQFMKKLCSGLSSQDTEG